MKKKREKSEIEVCEVEQQESDEYFYHIVGYTSNGLPYGITWEQAIEDGLIDCKKSDTNNEELPF